MVQDIVSKYHHPRASNGVAVVEEVVWGFLSLEAKSAWWLWFVTITLDKVVVSPHEGVSSDELDEPE